MLDQETIKRILHLHQVQGLKAGAIAERFGFSAARVHNVIRRQASSSNATRHNLFTEIEERRRKLQAPSSKRHEKDTMI